MKMKNFFIYFFVIFKSVQYSSGMVQQLQKKKKVLQVPTILDKRFH